MILGYSLLVNLLLLLSGITRVIAQEDGFKECKLGECEKWNVIVVPMLKDKEDDHLGYIKSFLTNAFSDCKWYRDYLNILYLNKKKELIPVMDHLKYKGLDHRIDDFIYTSEEQRNAHQTMLSHAIMTMPLAPADFGRYILILTNFDENDSGADISANPTMNQVLKDFGIQLRLIRLEFDGNRATHINPDQLFSYNEIHNISSNYVRVSFVETPSILSPIQPCPVLSPQERLDHYRYSKQYLSQYWLDRNSNTSLIGGILIGLFIIVVACSYLYHLREKRKPRKNSIINL